ncbi:MAG: type II toxin-antitoxin system RelE/ParE family toxin [Candidatus Peregrinibacteria bacterium]|nr:type II toxin-antitoxin system RelE/ParE family toxin [Candidatus Peregrinibacteria bacterium]MDZ4244552.1 type II toxin-antitoxin system RelE/ParE family toxin [Candidatus Gracilibacteria bacterium]
MAKYKLIFTERSVKDLKNLEKQVAKRIVDKLGFFTEQTDPLSFADKLKNPKFGTYKFRIGTYRAIFDIDKDSNVTILLVLTIKHRKEVYKDI